VPVAAFLNVDRVAKNIIKVNERSTRHVPLHPGSVALADAENAKMARVYKGRGLARKRSRNWFSLDGSKHVPALRSRPKSR
jgi:hypothetical protein